MIGLQGFIDRISIAGRRIAGSWLAVPVSADFAYERRVSDMVACLTFAFLAPLIMLPVLLSAFGWTEALAVALAAAALPLATAGVLSASGSRMWAGWLALAVAASALGALVAVSGGLVSPLLPLLAIVPLEAAMLSNNRMGLASGLLVAVLVLAAILVLGPIAAVEPVSQAGGIAAMATLGLYALVRGVLVTFRPSEAAGPTVRVEFRPDVTMTGQTATGEGMAGAEPIGQAATGGAVKAQSANVRFVDVLDRLPGLVTEHSVNGNVIGVTGGDRADYIARIGEVAGQGFVNRIHVADRIVFLDAFDALRRGEKRRDLEVRFERTDTVAQFVHATISMTAECDAKGVLLGVLAQTRDISDLVDGRLQANADAEEAEISNAAKTRFLAAVSHELRTPLNAIIGFSDILKQEIFGSFGDERQREYVGLIHQSGEHLLALVNTMLDMSKIESGRYEVFVEPFAIAEVVESCDAMLRLQASNRAIAMTRRLAPDVGEVIADRRAVQQILINLVGNAIKFTQAGGVINIDAAIEDGQLKLVVSDTGVGIPADKLALIGEPFVQVQNGLARHYEGTGLGLSLVKGLVDLHGGGFSIESREGEGTAVTISLPVDGSGARASSGDAAMPVVFPPALPKAVTPQNSIRNKDHAKTARSA